VNGYLLESTLVWSEGRSDWQPLSSIPELMSGTSQQGSDYSRAGDESPFLPVYTVCISLCICNANLYFHKHIYHFHLLNEGS